MPFKPKTCKQINVDTKTITTIDSKHNELLKKINNEEKKIPKVRKEIHTYKEMIKQKKYKNIEEKLNLIDMVKMKKKEIKELKKRKKSYLLNNSKYIFDYFESKQNISKNKNSKIIINNFFKIKSDQQEEENKNVNNQTLTKKYLSNICDRFLDINDYIINYESCPKCMGELVPIDYEGVLICNKCSYQTSYLIENEKTSYKEPPKEVSFYAYKRINHFREILAQFQAKETTQIEDKVLDDIKRQIKKERITLDNLTNDKTKDILKRLGYNKYYEHIPFIKEKLGIKPPRMSIELENKLCNLFIELQKPYSKFCPNDRVNFLNYYFALYKLCELLGHDEYLPYFYMLKDPIKRMEQDDIWRKICKELNWEFIATP